MAFCSNCGKSVIDGNRFCHHCGSPIVSVMNNTGRQQVYEGIIHKCPNCGAVVESFNTNCASCGYEFRSVKATSTVKDFSRQLQMIDAKRKNKSPISDVVRSSFGFMFFPDNIDNEMLSLIRSYPIPNTKEDLYEFIVLATSNIDEKLYENNAETREKTISNAWVAKADQAYNKAKLSFGTDSDFFRIQNIYDEEMSVVNQRKRNTSLFTFIAAAFLFIMAVSFMIFIGSRIHMYTKEGDERRREERAQIKELEEKLDEMTEEIYEDISNEDYDAALLKVNELRFDEDLSMRKAEKWDEKREYLIEYIKEKKGE